MLRSTVSASGATTASRIVLPNGPEMATAFVGVASGATSAPLNPAYKADEFEFYMSDLNAKALIVEAGSNSPAIAVAQEARHRRSSRCTPERANGRRRVSPRLPTAAIGRLRAGSARAGRRGAHPAHVGHHVAAEDRAAVAAQRLRLGRQHRRDASRFTAADRGLNVMPLFHIHGLMAGMLAPLSAGGSVFCTPGFNALQVLRAGWMRRSPPGTRRCRPCIRRSWRAPRATARSSRAIRCASSARRRRRCRRR